MVKKMKKMGVFIFAMMNVAIVLSLRGLPLIAKTGMNMIFFVLFASFLFLLPSALVSAELATGWIKDGGIYRWVKEAFGSKLGFTAIWLQWIQNTIWYTTVLAFAAGALSYLFLDPSLSYNKYFIIVVILVVYWGATFINFKGLKAASWFTTICVIGGTIVPAVLIIILGLLWVFSGNPLEFVHSSHTNFFPDFKNFDNLAFLAGTVLLFAGIEVNAVHVLDLKNPKKSYPKAVFVALAIIIVVFLLGSFSVAASIPAKDISLTAGIMQSFKDMLHMFKLDWLLPVMGFLVAFGAIGSVTAWIGGPSKGLLATAKHGELPPYLQFTNKNNVQTHILWIQGLIVTVLAFVFLLIPNVNTAFFLLTALTVLLYLIMYILLYLAGIVLRYTQPNVKRPYKIPGGNFGMWLVAGIGLLAVVFAFIVGFFPPSQLEIVRPERYVIFLIAGTVVFVTTPIIINHFKQPSWVKKNKKK
ncbi:MAG: Glutamate/gamma-aminobutyrate antiporter [Candidatus Anoxychlamydiales bacterium]|nr:Glutamate/gamma-aminobutyrate antiporter [Candidatus Anoxychlamydiales bacterium]